MMEEAVKKYLTGHYGMLIGIILFTELASLVINSILDMFVPMTANTVGLLRSALFILCWYGLSSLKYFICVLVVPPET